MLQFCFFSIIFPRLFIDWILIFFWILNILYLIWYVKGIQVIRIFNFTSGKLLLYFQMREQLYYRELYALGNDPMSWIFTSLCPAHWPNIFDRSVSYLSPFQIRSIITRWWGCPNSNRSIVKVLSPIGQLLANGDPTPTTLRTNVGDPPRVALTSCHFGLQVLAIQLLCNILYI